MDILGRKFTGFIFKTIPNILGFNSTTLRFIITLMCESVQILRGQIMIGHLYYTATASIISLVFTDFVMHILWSLHDIGDI